MNLPIPEDVCIPHPGFRWGPSGDAGLGTFPSLQGHSSSILCSFTVVTGANSKAPEAGFWKLVPPSPPPHFPGSALWPGSGVSSGSTVCSRFFTGQLAWSRLCRYVVTLHEAGVNSAVAETALTSTPRLRLRPLRSFPMHFLLWRG